MKDFLLEMFRWWHGQTWGTRWTIWRGGFKPVGTDEFGNQYFRSPTDRRFVVYNGVAEATKIPPGWHGWMHHRTGLTPLEEGYVAHPWEKAHMENMTGTALAYRPDGSLLNKGERPRVTGDYDAWSPE